MSRVVWKDCERCDRCLRRGAIYLPSWRGKSVIFLTSNWTVASLAAGYPSPETLRKAEALVGGLGLQDSKWGVDALVACGLSKDVLAEEVAVCAGRFVDESPTVICFLDQQARWLAACAGLIHNDRWQPVGSLHSAIMVDADGSIDEIGNRLASALGMTWRASPGPDRTLANYITETIQPDLRPKSGFSPYCVVRICREDALQELCFGKVVRKLRELLKTSLFVEDTTSREVFIYVRLPEMKRDWQAQSWLTAYLARCGLLWRRVGFAGHEYQCDMCKVYTTATLEHGLRMVGDNSSPSSQLVRLVDFFARKDASDYQLAEKSVRRETRKKNSGIKLRGGNNGDAKRLRRWVRARELDLLSPGVEAGEWEALDDVELKKVAATGVPYFGTVDKWLDALVYGLIDRVPMSRIEELMQNWILKHPDRSPLSQSHLRSYVSNRVEKIHSLAGPIPERIWFDVRDILQDALLTTSTLTPGEYGPYYSTAFAILRRYFKERRHARAIYRSEFVRFVTDDKEVQMREVLTKAVNGQQWLRRADTSSQGVVYELVGSAWPRRPGDKMIIDIGIV